MKNDPVTNQLSMSNLTPPTVSPRKPHERLRIEQIEFTDGTIMWSVERRGTRLGLVSWYYPWRTASFAPGNGTVFSTDCLAEIAQFLAELNAEAKGRTAKCKS